MEITGNVTWVGAPQKGTSQRTGNAWSKQSFEVEYIGGQYPKRIVLDTLDANIVGKLAIGQKVNVKFDFETREYNGKKYNEVKI